MSYNVVFTIFRIEKKVMPVPENLPSALASWEFIQLILRRSSSSQGADFFFFPEDILVMGLIIITLFNSTLFFERTEEFFKNNIWFLYGNL